MGKYLSRLTQRPTQAQIQYVTPVRPVRAAGLVGQIYEQVAQDFGILAPPITLHSPAPSLLAAGWLILRETLVATGQASRAVKEAVAVAVSRANSCPYCVEVHGSALHGLIGVAAALAVAEGRTAGLADGQPDRLARWAVGGERGEPLPAPIGHIPELIGTAVTFHYLNRMVNVFLVESPIPPEVPTPVRRMIQRLAGRILRPDLTRRIEPGRSVELLPTAALPADLSWAAGVPAVGAAFARAVAAFEAAGDRSVPVAVRDVVSAELDAWDGRPPGLDSGWLSDRLATLSPEYQPVGRLALLVAMASYRVTPQVVAAVRRGPSDDRRLIEITGWASMAAARRLGERLWIGSGGVD